MCSVPQLHTFRGDTPLGQGVRKGGGRRKEGGGRRREGGGRSKGEREEKDEGRENGREVGEGGGGRENQGHWKPNRLEQIRLQRETILSGSLLIVSWTKGKS